MAGQSKSSLTSRSNKLSKTSLKSTASKSSLSKISVASSRTSKTGQESRKWNFNKLSILFRLALIVLVAVLVIGFLLFWGWRKNKAGKGGQDTGTVTAIISETSKGNSSNEGVGKAVAIAAVVGALGLAIGSGLAIISNSINNSSMLIHLSLGPTPHEMAITWHSIHTENYDPRLPMVVIYGKSSTMLTQMSKASTNVFNLDKGSSRSFNQLIFLLTYRALMVDLQENTVYYYRVGNKKSGWSNVAQFTTIQSSDDWNPWILVWGDLGLNNSRALPFIVRDINTKRYCAVFHLGDFAYNLHTNRGNTGNQFMKMIESVASRVPYQTCPGNHEKRDNFSHYDARFTMHQQNDESDAPSMLETRNHFYSVNIGPAHLILFSTEFYYFTEFGWEQIERQFRFLKQDLLVANKNRKQRPWIITMAHRSFYCLRKTNKDKSCDSKRYERKLIRKGIRMHDQMGSKPEFGLESLFFKYGVDLCLWGHDHFYARTFPLYDFKVYNGTSSTDNPYHNANAPIHVITGAAGNKEEHSKFLSPLPSFLAFHVSEYSYTRIKFNLQNELRLEQVSAQKNKVIDKFTIVKDNAMP